jgi:hypothetical protein
MSTPRHRLALAGASIVAAATFEPFSAGAAGAHTQTTTTGEQR